MAHNLLLKSVCCVIRNDNCLSALVSLNDHSSNSSLIRLITLMLLNIWLAELQAVLYQLGADVSGSYTSMYDCTQLPKNSLSQDTYN